MLAVLVVVTGSAAAGAAQLPFLATLKAPTHRPRVGTKWFYVIHVADLRGKPIAARLTEVVTDPTGGTHPVLYGATRKRIVNWPFTGRFRDYIVWPAESKLSDYLGGLVLRATVRARGAKTVLTYRVKPR